MPNIVIIGGGTSTATILSGLKNEPSFHLTAVVPVSDSGGSSKIFLDAFAHTKAEKQEGHQDIHIVPPGDVANALVAMSHHNNEIATLLNYRFANLETVFTGHSLRNIILGAAMERFGMEGIDIAASLFDAQGRVIPVASEALHLAATLQDGTVFERYAASDPRNPKKTITLHGEEAIDFLPYQHTVNQSIVDIHLKPYGDTPPSVHPQTRQAIEEADLILFSPSDLWTSTAAILAVPGVSDALKRTQARRCYFIPLTTKRLNTNGFTARNFVEVIERYSFPRMIDTVLFNTGAMSTEALQQEQCVQENATPVPLGNMADLHARVIQVNLVNGQTARSESGDTIARSVIRHDPDKVLAIVRELVSTRDKA